MAVRQSSSYGKALLVVAVVSLQFSTGFADSSGEEVNSFTPVPFTDISKDLKPFYFGAMSDYFISTYQTDARTARQVCQNLTTLTGKHFHLLMLENKDEVSEIQAYLDSVEHPGIWVGGEKTRNEQGEIALYWVTEDGVMRSMEFRNFRDGAPLRRRRDIGEISEDRDKVMQVSNSSVTSMLYPWLNVGRSEGHNGRCRNGKYSPPACEPVQCNVTMPECTTVTPDCIILNQTDCSVTRPPCTAKCENCTVSQPICYVKSKPCTVNQEECQVIRAPCTVITPPCVTTRPPCKTIQPPCEVTAPPPCTTRAPCIPSFRKDNCTTVNPPCKTNSKNETVCPPPKTVCENSYKCPPPEVCQSPPIQCPPPLIYCEPETTVCPDPTYSCPKPAIYCPEPEVDCPEPEIICSAPQAACDPPVVTCLGIVTSCSAPQLQCDPPKVNCPDPIVECTKPEPCLPPEPPLPPCTPEPTTTTTTQRPCPGCGCVYMSKQHKFQWDIAACTKKYHFICEG